MRRLFSLLFIGCVCAGGSIQANTIKRETIVSESKKRSYYLYVPENLNSAKPAPLIVALHGSGDTGQMPVKRWRDLAAKEGILIAGPNALDREAWRIPEDGPEFIYEMVESLKKKHSIDPQRVYLFGHSGGAIAALYLAMLQSEYFAAAAIHAGAIFPEDEAFVARPRRKIPFSLFVGTKDPLFPVADLRQTRDMLTAQGYAVDLTEIKNHDHDYGKRSAEINAMIWEFFKSRHLDTAPRHQLYDWENVKPRLTEIR